LLVSQSHYCRYVVTFLRYSALNDCVTLKSGFGVVQGHLLDYILLYWSAIASIVSYTILELFDVEQYRDLEIWVRGH